MTELNAPDNLRRRPGSRRVKKHNLRVDMTPMVDLGFILITFFVVTVTLSKPVAVHLIMPKDSPDSTTLGKSDALTVLLAQNDRVFYYNGSWKEALANNEVFTTDFSFTGIGNVIREKQKWLDVYNKKEGRRGLMLLIKPGKDASYKNVIDALDETAINAVKKYAVLSAGTEESEWMRNHQ